MGQQVTQRDRPLCRAQLGCSRGIESVKHLGRPERGIDVRHRSIQRKLVLLDELQRGDRSDRLNHRGDTKYGIARHGRPPVKPAPAENALIHDALVGRGQGHHPRHFLCTGGRAEHRVDLGKRACAEPCWLFGVRDRRIVRA